MKFVKKWPALLVLVILAVFLSVELSFFIANIAKIKQRWMFLIFEIMLVFIMYIWFRARKITNRFLQFETINRFVNALHTLSVNVNEPKYATHLVYLSKANNNKNIEKRILESIFSKRPKRADVYWFIHIDRTDEPYTMEYSVEEIEHDKIIRIEFRLGFRIQPRINLFLKKVMQEMVEHHDLEIGNSGESPFLNKHNISADVRYVLIQKFLSIENEFSFKDSFILNSYFAISNLGQSDKKAFGLEMGDTAIERIPLVVSPVANIPLKRIPHT